MSGTAVVPRPRLRNDLAACRRHFAARLRMAARDPLALGVLAFAGVVTVALWNSQLGIDPLRACRLPWPGGAVAYNGPAPTAVELALFLPSGVVVVTQLLWAGIVAWALGRESLQVRRSAARSLPALPLGVRSRILAEALVATVLVTAARAIVLSLGGVRLGRVLFGHDASLAVFPDVRWLFQLAQPAGSALTLAAYASALAVSTLLGTLLVFPLVLAWSTAARLDGRGLVKPAIAALLVFGAVGVGATAHLGSAVVVSALVSAFLLARLDDGDRSAPLPAGSSGGSAALRFRVSPGPLAQLREDSWLGFLRTRWLFLSLSVALPLVLTLAYRLDFLGQAFAGSPLFARTLIGTVVLLQWLVLTAAAFFPFGLALIPAGTRPGALFSGAFLGSWRALPVRRDTVVRVVYAHGLLGAGLAWLVLCGQVALLGARFGPLLYALPVVFLVAGLVVCEAVGDRKRGLTAVAALLGYQLGVPLAYALVTFLLGVGSDSWRASALACAVALVGILPPLVHLRRSLRATG